MKLRSSHDLRTAILPVEWRTRSIRPDGSDVVYRYETTAARDHHLVEERYVALELRRGGKR